MSVARGIICLALAASAGLSACSPTRPPDAYLNTLQSGVAAYKKADYPAADKLFARAAEIAARAPITPETFGTGMTLQSVKVAAPALSQSIDVWTVVLGADHPAVLTGLMQMAYLYYLNHSYKRGDEAIDRALNAYKKSGKDLPSTAETWVAFIPQLLSSQGELERADAVFQKIIAAHRKVKGKDAAVVARYQLDYANWYAHRRMFDKALAMADEVAQRDESKHADAATRASTNKKVAWILAQSGRFSDAEKKYQQCIHLLSADREAARKAEHDLALFYEEYGGFSKALAQRRKAYATAKEEGAKFKEIIGPTHDLIGLTQINNPEQAALMAAEAVDAYEKNLGPATPQAAHMMHHVSQGLASSGHPEQARSAANWGMALLAWDPRGHLRDLIGDMNRFAERFSAAGYNDDARGALARAVELGKQSSGQQEWGVQESPETLALKRKADWLRIHGTSTESIDAYKQAIAVSRKDKSKDEISVAQYLVFQSEAALERGEFQVADDASGEAAKIYTSWMGKDSARQARVLALKARAQAGLKLESAAAESKRRAAAMLVANAKVDPFDCAEGWLNLAKLGLEQKNPADARAAFQQVVELKRRNGVLGDMALARGLDGEAIVAELDGKPKEALKLSDEAMLVLSEVCNRTPYAVPIATHNLRLLVQAGDAKRAALQRPIARRWANELYGPEDERTRALLKL